MLAYAVYIVRSPHYTLHTHLEKQGYKLSVKRVSLWHLLIQPCRSSRFSAPQNHRTHNDRYVLVNVLEGEVVTKRLLGRLKNLVSIDGIPYPHVAEPLKAEMAIVDIFDPVSNRDFPWSNRAVDCGIRVTSSVRFTTLAVPITSLAAPTLVLPIEGLNGERLCVSISCDTEGPEPEYWVDAEGELEEQSEDENEDEDDIDDPGGDE